MPEHFISASCQGERCRLCGAPATHKVGEEIAHDDPQQMRHNLTAYVCCLCFARIVGPAAPCHNASDPRRAWIEEQLRRIEIRHHPFFWSAHFVVSERVTCGKIFFSDDTATGHFLRLRIERPDRDTGKIGPGLSRRQFLTEAASSETVLWAALRCLRDISEHECDETIHVDGVPIWTPHRYVEGELKAMRELGLPGRDAAVAGIARIKSGTTTPSEGSDSDG